MDTLKAHYNESEKFHDDSINEEVASFFDTAPIMNNVVVHDSWEDLAKTWCDLSDEDEKDRQAPNWLVAFATHSDIIHILSPAIMPAGHENNSIIRFDKTLKHELSHLYVNHINSNVPSWLKEGTSLYVAEQNHHKKVDVDAITIPILKKLNATLTDGRAYDFGKTVVDQIVENFGKQKLFDIIAIRDKDERHTELKKMFDWLK